MLIVVAIQAKQLPIAAVERIVIVVVILMMDGKFPEPLALELASAARANPGKELEGALTIALHPEFTLAPGFGNDRVHLGAIGSVLIL